MSLLPSCPPLNLYQIIIANTTLYYFNHHDTMSLLNEVISSCLKSPLAHHVTQNKSPQTPSSSAWSDLFALSNLISYSPSWLSTLHGPCACQPSTWSLRAWIPVFPSSMNIASYVPSYKTFPLLGEAKLSIAFSILLPFPQVIFHFPTWFFLSNNYHNMLDILYVTFVYDYPIH